MNSEIVQTTAQGNGVGFCELIFGPACFIKPVSETIPTPEPDFEQVKDLYNDKPLNFNRPHISKD